MDDRSEEHDIEVDGAYYYPCERKISGILDDGSVGFQQPLLAKNRKNTTSQIAIVGANTCPIESLDYESLFSPWISLQFDYESIKFSLFIALSGYRENR